MTNELPSSAQRLASRQSSVLALSQAPELGLGAQSMKNRVRYGDWQRLQRGVYATYTGNPTREARLWAAILRAGPGAVLSHFTAAERHGLLDEPSTPIHVTVPAIRNPARCGKIPGVVLHRSDSVFRTCHPAMAPPCTRIEDTVLDIIKIIGSFDAKFYWVCQAVGSRRTTPERILESLGERKRFPCRSQVQVMLGYAAEGIMSWLERQWADGVEHAHGIPAARRQVRVRQETGNTYLDNLYEEYRICVELDGTVAHPESERWRDHTRDRWNLVHEKIVTVRFGVQHLRDRQDRCEAAADMICLLNDRGPKDAPRVGHPCGQACPVQRLYAGS